MPYAAEWVQKSIDSLRPKSLRRNESDGVLSELQKQLDELKQKLAAEMDNMLFKWAQTKSMHDKETVREEKDKSDSPTIPKDATAVMSHSWVANSRFRGKLVNRVKPTS